MSLKSIAQAPGTKSKINEDFIRSSIRLYRALFATTDDEYYVLAHCGYGIHQAHPSDPQQFIVDMEAELIAAQTTAADNSAAALWQITLNYGPWDPLTHSYDGNPLHVPMTFHLEFTLAEVAAFEDVDGDPIVNSAGDPYDPPLMREVTRAKLVVRRNEAPGSVSIPTLAALSNTVNEAAWNGFPIKTVRLAPITIPEVMYSQVTNAFYFPMQYEFDINFDTWVKQVVNAGFRALDSSGNLIPILINGQPAQVPVPLDESGQAILAPSYKDDSGDVPPDSNPEGETGEVAGGGEPASGGDGEIGGNLVIDAYDLIRAADFTFLNMDNLFTLPTI